MCPREHPRGQGRVRGLHLCSGDVVFYFCNNNFTLEGLTSATCQANGQLNQSVSECVDMLDYSAAVAYFLIFRFLQFFCFCFTR